MKSRNLKTVILACLFLAVFTVVALFGVRGLLPRAQRHVSAKSENIQIKPMHENSGEDVEKVTVDANGDPLIVEVFYKNGDHGFRYMRPDHSQREVKIDFKGRPGVRKHAFFADDGKLVVEGWEKRQDGTTLWETKTDEEGVINTTYFWYDGKRAFSKSTYKPGATSMEIEYFRKDGSKWADQVTDRTGEIIIGQELYRKDGQPLEMRVLIQHGLAHVYYRPDGTERLVQVYRNGSNGSPSASTWTDSSALTLAQVILRKTDGQSSLQEITMSQDGSGIARVVTYKDDLTRETTTLRQDGTVEKVDVTETDGQLLNTTNHEASENVQFTVDKALLAPEGPLVDLKAFWQKQEDDPSARSTDAP